MQNQSHSFTHISPGTQDTGHHPPSPPAAFRDIYGLQQRWDHLLSLVCMFCCVLRRIRPRWIFLLDLGKRLSINKLNNNSVLGLHFFLHFISDQPQQCLSYKKHNVYKDNTAYQVTSDVLMHSLDKVYFCLLFAQLVKSKTMWLIIHCSWTTDKQPY